MCSGSELQIARIEIQILDNRTRTQQRQSTNFTFRSVVRTPKVSDKEVRFRLRWRQSEMDEDDGNRQAMGNRKG